MQYQIKNKFILGNIFFQKHLKNKYKTKIGYQNDSLLKQINQMKTKQTLYYLS